MGKLNRSLAFAGVWQHYHYQLALVFRFSLVTSNATSQLLRKIFWPVYLLFDRLESVH